MRLSDEEIQHLKSSLKKLSTTARLYLFGSRIDDSKRGGDIDLLVVADDLDRHDIRLLRIQFFEKFGEQKLDIVLDDGSLVDPFVKHIFPKAVEL